MIGPEGTLEAEPGLWVHVVRVASVQSDFVLRELLKESDLYEPLPGNTVILANKALEIIEGEVTPPYSAVWVNVQRDPECLVCGDAVQAARLRDKDEVVSLDQLPIDVEIEFDEDEAQQGVSDK